MNSQNSVFITGATGFVGRVLVKQLLANMTYELNLLVREEIAPFDAAVNQIVIPRHNSFGGRLPLDGALAVIHLAGRAHILNDKFDSPLSEFRRVNVQAMLDLARQSIAAGVKRFIFISSIGVNGSQTNSGSFRECSPPHPIADYAISKFEAEQELRSLTSGSPMELVIIRPPLVYAGHAPGNFRRLLKLVSTGMPLPFASVLNSRSMVALENLVDFVSLCIRHPAAANELFLVADAQSVSTVEMMTYLAEGMGVRQRLFPMPDILLRTGASLLGKQAIYSQLCGSLVVDSSKAQELLGWAPPVSTFDALRQAGRDYIALRNRKL